MRGKMMNPDEKLLNTIYHNSMSAVTFLSQILQKTDNRELFEMLFDDMLLFREILYKSHKALSSQDMLISTQKLTDRVAVNFTSQVMRFRFISVTFLATTLKNSCLEGIFDITNSINSSVNTSESVRMLAYELIKIEEKIISQMNGFYNAKNHLYR